MIYHLTTSSLNQAPSQRQRLAKGQTVNPKDRSSKLRLTIKTGIVRLNMHCLDLAILELKSITLASQSTKDRSTVESQVQSFCELRRGVTKKADLYMSALVAMVI
jgi:hypothetical protein